jgi:hypothetical protein
MIIRRAKTSAAKLHDHLRSIIKLCNVFTESPVESPAVSLQSSQIQTAVIDTSAIYLDFSESGVLKKPVEGADRQQHYPTLSTP